MKHNICIFASSPWNYAKVNCVTIALKSRVYLEYYKYAQNELTKIKCKRMTFNQPKYIIKA